MPLTCPSNWLDADAICLALSHLPPRLEVEYQRKLELNDSGTILELALLGRLISKNAQFAVSPWPALSRVDAHLERNGRVLELEIKASIQTLYDKNVAKMCQLVEEQVKRRWPKVREEINLFNDFREIESGNSKTLDIEGTAGDVMEELEKAITPEGEVRPTFRRYVPFRLVTRILPSETLRVWHSSSRLPGGHGEEVLKRTLQRSLVDRNQFSGKRPAILAVIMARDPDSGLLYRFQPSVADECFAEHPVVSALVGVPCPSVNGPPVVLTPGTDDLPERVYPLMEDEPQALAEFLAVRLQVGPIWDGLEQKLRESPQEGAAAREDES